MKIHIPTNQENESSKASETLKTEENLTEEYVTTSSGVSVNEEDEQTKTSKVNINTATQTQLETLPGIGPSTAAKIVEYRTEKGKFKSIEEIMEVSGIGEAKFEKMKEYITVK